MKDDEGDPVPSAQIKIESGSYYRIIGVSYFDNGSNFAPVMTALKLNWLWFR